MILSGSAELPAGNGRKDATKAGMRMKQKSRVPKIDFNSIKTRLLCTLLLTFTVLSALLGFVGYKIFEKTLIDEIGTNRSDVLSQIGDRVKIVKSDAYTLSNLYFYDSSLTKAIVGLSENDGAGARALTDYLDGMTAQFKKSFNEYNMDFTVVIAAENGYGYCSETVAEDYDYMRPQTKVWYKRMLFAKGEIIDIANYKDKKSGANYFSAARCINNEQGEPIAYLMVNVNERQMHSMYEHVISGDGNIYIVDGEGTVISSSNEKLNGFNFFNMDNLKRLFGDHVYTITSMRGEDILFTKYYEEVSGFTVLEEISLKKLLEPINRLRVIIFWITAATILVSAVAAEHLAQRTTKPISGLCDFMVQVGENNLDRECEVKGFTEINILSQGLNDMMGRIRSLMESIRQKEQQKRKMELSFLQAQINPHFMYNTLFSVKCMVDMQHNQEASQMLTSFIQLLRSTLSNPDQFVTIDQEFQVLKQYVEIQKYRYSDQLEVIFECDDQVLNKKIPKLLIQPLLENAIFHGVEFKKEDGLVIITARLSGENVIVTVEDNGVGIAPETLEQINRGERLSDKAHVGIVNVKERIQLNFGEAYGMEIESIQWHGTKIILTFPAIE